MAGSRVQIIGEATEPDERIRIEWGQSLGEHMGAQDVSVKELIRRLRVEHGISVSRQNVEAWLAGKYAPRPHYQAAIGSVLNAPARRIFDLPNLPKRKAS